jgi:hypothetical protein
VRAEHLQPAAIGFSSHSGWAAAVCLGGPVSAPSVIERSRILLTSAPLPCEPYHDAKRGKPEDAEKTVAAAAEKARRLALEGIRSHAGGVEAAGFELVASGVVLGGGKPGVTLARALSTHAAMHGAEGWLFREALIEASQNCDLIAVGVPESELPARSAAALGSSEGSARDVFQQLGRNQGPPWGRDQKAAAMAALVALSSASEPSPPAPA